MEARLKQDTDQVKEQLVVAVETIGQLGTRVDLAEKRMDGLIDEVKSIVDMRMASNHVGVTSGNRDCVVLDQSPSVAASTSSTYATALASGGLDPTSTNVSTKLLGPRLRISPEKKREEDYWQCRKKLRLRPIGPGDPVTEVKKFMTEHLGLSPLFMESVGHFSVQRLPFGPSAKIQNEAVVTYLSTDVRDAVKSAMKALQAVSYEIKTKFPMARRNVLFDDETLDLVLDFATSEGQPWKRMSSAQAILRKKRRPDESKVTLGDGEIDALLDDSPTPDPSPNE